MDPTSTVTELHPGRLCCLYHPGLQRSLVARPRENAQHCRSEYLIGAHIYAQSGILTHAFSTLPAIAADSQPAYPGFSICEPLPAAGPGTALPRFYVTTDVAARQIQLQVRRTSDCAVTAVVPLPDGWLLTGGISATAGDRTFFAAAFSASRCPVQAGVGGISYAAHETRFFRFAVNDQGRAGRLTVVGPPVSGIVGPVAASPDGSRIAFNAADGNYVGPGTACAGGEAEGAAIRVIDLATGKIRTWQTPEMPPAPAGTSVTPHEVSWMADGRTLAVSYVWPASPSGPQLRLRPPLAEVHQVGRVP